MADLATLAGAGLLLWWLTRSRRRTGPGASAAARARQFRTPAVRLADAVGIPTRASRQAARWQAGAEGERATAQLLAPLPGEGWAVLHDRALPGTRANLDHLVISPHGAVILPDSKQWTARHPLTVHGGRLRHGDQDVTDRLNGLRHETAAVSRLLGTPVTPLVVMHGAPVPAAGLTVDGIRIVPASRALAVMRRCGAARGGSAAQLAARAEQLLPPYREGGARRG